MRNLKNLIFIIVIMLGLVAGFLLAKRSYVMSTKALVPQTLADVRLDKTPIKDGLTKVTISFKTGDSEKKEEMSLLAFRIRSTADVVGENGREISEIKANDSFAESMIWEIPVNKIMSIEGEDHIDFAAVNTDKVGFATSEYVELAHFYIKDAEGVSVEFVPELSHMYSKKRPVTDIWNK